MNFKHFTILRSQLRTYLNKKLKIKSYVGQNHIILEPLMNLQQMIEFKSLN